MENILINQSVAILCDGGLTGPSLKNKITCNMISFSEIYRKSPEIFMRFFLKV